MTTPGVVFQAPQRTALAFVGLAREERVVPELVRDLSPVPVRTSLGVQGQHQLCHASGACASEATLSAIRS
ncbi:hypothetical protein [Streptomyces sp. NPDC058869]|uniref:hypothetical protein n=1 Tax=Streptomyces sp. NPDC058869 TaxID=3346659 RepID=UPI003673BE6F